MTVCLLQQSILDTVCYGLVQPDPANPASDGMTRPPPQAHRDNVVGVRLTRISASDALRIFGAI